MVTPLVPIRPPAGLFELPATALADHCEDLTLLRLGPAPGAGALPGTLFVSVLLHGNETAGWEALCRLLADRGDALPRSVIVLLGNLGAARSGLRRHDGQADFNRIWKDHDGVERARVDAIVEALVAEDLLCAVDVHNNTGSNPHYACVTRSDPVSLALAQRFARPAVYVRQPDSVLMRALAPFTPSIVLEAGRPGEADGVAHVVDYLAWLLDCPALPEAPAGPLDLYRTVASVRLRDGVRFGFRGTAPEDAELELLPGFEARNFSRLDPGTRFAHVPGAVERWPLGVFDDDGADVTARYFERRADEVVLARSVVPAMFSPDETILRQDVVCYLMERFA